MIRRSWMGFLDGTGDFAPVIVVIVHFFVFKNLLTLTRRLSSARPIKTPTQTHSISSGTTIYGPSSMLAFVFMMSVTEGHIQGIAPSETRTTRKKSLPSVQLLGRPAPNRVPRFHLRQNPNSPYFQQLHRQTYRKMTGICL